MKKYKFKAKIEAGDGEGAYVLFRSHRGSQRAAQIPGLIVLIPT